MDRQRRFELLASVPAAEAQRLAERVMDGSLGDAAVIVPPTVGMVMARATDGARGQRFNLAEVLVTEARVSLGGHEGWGMVMGRAPEHALAVALVDAGLEAGHAAREGIERDLTGLWETTEARLAAEWAQLAPTKVDFDNF